MTPDISILLEQWLRFNTPDAGRHPATVPATLGNASRARVADMVLEDMRAMDAPQIPDAARTAKVFVEEVAACELKPDDMTSEANALCLAVLNADLHGRSQKDNVPTGQTFHFINSFLEIITTYYLKISSEKFSPTVCQAESPRPPESLQHALRSPLQGAMLFLDLMREDAQHGAVTLEDIDSVIDSLRHVTRLLDAHRDTQN